MSRLRNPVFLLVFLLSTGHLSAQRVVRSFDGDSGPGLAACESGITHCDRPDMNMGASGTQVVQVTWQNVRVYDHSGKLLRVIATKDFIRSAGLDPQSPARNPADDARAPQTRGPFEPHVLYDEFLQRWIMTVTCLNDCVLVSESSDALGKWGGVYWSCSDGDSCLSSDPAIHLGYDRNGIYVCGGHVGDDNPNTIPQFAYDCFAAATADVKGIAAGKAPAAIHRKHAMPHEVYPVIDHNPAKPPTAPAFFLAKTCSRAVRGGCQNATDYRFDWIVNSFTWSAASGSWDNEQLVKTDVGSHQSRWLFNIPCCERLSFPQRGSSILVRAAESHRLTNVVQHGTHLYGVTLSGPCRRDCGDQGVDDKNIMFWADIDCARPAACVVGQTGKIAGDFNPDFPTIGVDGAGNLGIVAASSTADTYLSLLLWTRRVSDPPNSFRGPTVIAAGTQPWTCMNRNNLAEMANPAGIDTTLDPADGSKLWTTHQWSIDGDRCVWNTRIVQYQITGEAKKR